MLVKTRNGLFANEGHGGGVFNYNTAFGSAPEDDSRTIEGLVNPNIGLRGLGNLPVNRNIPFQCWERPGFKDCHAVAYDEGRDLCAYCAQNPEDEHLCGGFTSMEDCVERVVNDMSWKNCVASFCPQQDPGMREIDLNFTEYSEGDPCSSSNTIKNVQFVAGTKTDGIWGPLSDEAYETLVRVQGTTYCELVPGCIGPTPYGGTCAAATPGPVPVSPPSPQPESPPLEEDIPEEVQMTKGSVFLIAGVLAAVAGTVAILGSKKKG